MPVLVYMIYSRTSRPIGQEVLYGAGDEARTRYLHLGKVALYRMSYTRGTCCIIADIFRMSRYFYVFQNIFLFFQIHLDCICCLC